MAPLQEEWYWDIKKFTIKYTTQKSVRAINLWFVVFLTCPEIYCDWSVHNPSIKIKSKCLQLSEFYDDQFSVI